MATYTIDQYQKKMRGMAKQLRRAASKSTNSAAQFMVATARGMAPSKSGALRAGITAKPIKDQEWQVSSKVPGDFPYNLWINRTAPYRTLNFPKGGWSNSSGGWIKYFSKGDKAVYGDGSHRNTGTPRFWHFSVLRTADVFGRITRKNIQKMLQVKLV